MKEERQRSGVKGVGCYQLKYAKRCHKAFIKKEKQRLVC